MFWTGQAPGAGCGQLVSERKPRPILGAKVAVGLATFSGLGWPGQINKLLFRNLVELSLAKRRFLEVPSRIQLLGVRNRRAAVIKYCTFLSSRGCEWLLEDLKSRSPRPRAESPVVTEQGSGKLRRRFARRVFGGMT